jgi:Rieske 2Fe-2S family protein
MALDVWEGHIFLNLSTSPPPLAAQLGGLLEKFRPWDMGSLRVGKRIVYDVAANWKLIIQNYSECLHCPGVHPALQRLSHFLSGENEPAHPSYLGGRMDLRDGIETLSMDGKRHRDCLPGLPADDCRRVYYYALLPNLLLSLHPDYMMTHTLWPRSVGRTEIVCEWHFHPDAWNQTDFGLDSAVSFWDMTNRQDWHVCEQMQLGVGSRAYRPGPYSNREDLLYGFDCLVRGE